MATQGDRRAAVVLLVLAAAGLMVRFWQAPGAAPGAVAYHPAGPRPERDSVAARALRLARPLARGEHLDLDRATPEELARLPRVGPGLAARIVADREAHGPFGSLEVLDRVSGIGSTVLEAVRPFAVFSGRSDGQVAWRSSGDTTGSPLLGPPAPQPVARYGPPLIDPAAPVAPPYRRRGGAAGSGNAPAVRLNTATEAELTQLPRIGPGLARAIVADRVEQGPFRTLDDLKRVRGIGDATLRGLKGRIVLP
jgi:competence protein ComEA